MEGKANALPGYAVVGRLFAVGSIKGLCDGFAANRT